MKTVEEVRRERLQMLRTEFGTWSVLNEKLGLVVRDSTLSQYLNASKGTKTKKPKVMGSPMARRLEAACGKEVGWMDTDPALTGESAGQQAIQQFQALRESLRAEVLAELGPTGSENTPEETREARALEDRQNRRTAKAHPSVEGFPQRPKG